jgi:hypothetical protein
MSQRNGVIQKRIQRETPQAEKPDGVELLPFDGRLITQSRNESVDGVAFVSGIQGVIATTFMVEAVDPIIGVKHLKRAYGSVELVTLSDIYRIEQERPKSRLS